CRHYYSTPYTF
nr:immunoglobulin light chain junction region [Macaca mulatta]